MEQLSASGQLQGSSFTIIVLLLEPLDRSLGVATVAPKMHMSSRCSGLKNYHTNPRTRLVIQGLDVSGR